MVSRAPVSEFIDNHNFNQKKMNAALHAPRPHNGISPRIQALEEGPVHGCHDSAGLAENRVDRWS